MLSHLTYKPGWRFSIGYDGFQNFYIQLHVIVIDTTKLPQKQTIELTFQAPLNVEIANSLPEDGLIEWIFNYVVLGWERHEAQEWYRYRGAMVKDPHEEERKVYLFQT